MVAKWSILIDMPELGISSTMGWLYILATSTGSRHFLVGLTQSSGHLSQSSRQFLLSQSSRQFLQQHLFMNVTS